MVPLRRLLAAKLPLADKDMLAARTSRLSVSTIICPDSQSVWDTFTTGKSPASRFRYDDRISACRSL